MRRRALTFVLLAWALLLGYPSVAPAEAAIGLTVAPVRIELEGVRTESLLAPVSLQNIGS